MDNYPVIRDYMSRSLKLLASAGVTPIIVPYTLTLELRSLLRP